jgi:predicted GNAT family acetyltransferase
MTPTVVDNPQELRYEIRVGDELAGFSTYARLHGVITFIHTEIDPAYEGQGLGTTLARAVLDAARAAGLRVRPRCPFIRAFIERHAEYADLVDPE